MEKRKRIINMKRIGIITWFKSHNYGTALQVTALIKKIQELNYSPTVIKYYEKKAPVSYLSNINIVGMLTKVHTKMNSCLFDSYLKEISFSSFYDAHLFFSSPCYTLYDLQRLNNQFDAFVCGSDQIWAPSCFDSHFFLDFVFDDNKKIAYAPSVGLPTIEDKYIRSQIKHLTKKIRFLSTREESGSKIISELSGRNVQTVLDPTLLLNAEQWQPFYKNVTIRNQKPYLLVYMLGKNESQWKVIYKIADVLNLAVKIIPVFKKDLKRQGYIKDAVGPAEFLAYLQNASYVCTDSFHGLAFSVNFHKPFTVFERFKANDKLNQNSRIYNLLDKLQLRNRLYLNGTSLKMLDDTINYDLVEKKRKALADESISYLSNALAAATSSKPKIQKNNIHRNNSMCCGCGACKTVCPCNAVQIKMDKDGFYSAFVDNDKCVSCGKCTKVCPYMIDRNDQEIAKSVLYSFKSNSADVLLRSSSGGAAHHISEMLCKKGYSVAGCTFDVDSQTAKHILIESKHTEELGKLQGSKYMQSNFAVITQQLYKGDAPTVIFGTPCQIAGMRSLLKDRENIIFVDLICHGVPSYHLYSKYLFYLREHGFKTDRLSVIFRDKKYGWSSRYITVSDSKRTQTMHQNKDPFFLSFEQCLCYSHNCYECPWRDKSAADLRLGDYWGNKFKSDKTGVSEIVVLTDKGKEVVDMLIGSGIAEIHKQDIQDYTSIQQMTNGREPVFWHSYIRALADPNTKMEDIMKKYILPFERRKRMRKAASKAYHLLKDIKK
ncbi:MAG: polysaccharide pyruvyl transferase family protein [Oscillospiraceae bacterium]|nr:polysaccharide pyruvyl transferase family protein [Oscillospiraceae bacterium]